MVHAPGLVWGLLLIFSVKRLLCIQYMSPASGVFAPRPPSGLCPWTPLGASVPSPLFCPLPSKFLATPLPVDIRAEPGITRFKKN